MAGARLQQPSLLHARVGAAISMTTEGLLVTGGQSDSSYYGTTLASTEVFSSGQWVNSTDLPVPMARHCQVTTGQGVIVAGMVNTPYK